MKKVFAFTLMVFSLLSCSKQDVTENQTFNLFNNDDHQIAARCSSERFTSIFKSIEIESIRAAISSEDSEILNEIIEKFNESIISVYHEEYGIDLATKFDNDEKYGITLMGIYSAAKEKYIMDGYEVGIDEGDIPYDEIDESFDCFLTAVSTAIGISDAKSLWKSIIGGAAQQTVISSLKLMAKRVAAAWTVVVLVYEVGVCLDWW